MGGTIHLTSQEGVGAAFTFEISLPVLSDPAPHPTLESPLTGVRVLVVDDNQICRFLTAKLCTNWGMCVNEAATGEAALHEIAVARENTDPYQVLCLGFHMPGIDGADVATSRRAAYREQCPAIVLITSSVSPDSLQRARSAGAGVCLVKPVRDTTLQSAIHHVLGIGVPSPARRAAPSAPPVLFTGRRILLVEDSIINQKLAGTLLKKMGCQVDYALNGQEAVAATAKTSYDLIFMDCQMPVMDGFQATVEIRKSETPDHRTPIVALTAGAFAEDRDHCKQAGMDDFLTKPVRREDLENTLAHFLGKAQAEPA